MERREALKNIGFGSAAIFGSSVLFGALQGCSSAPEVNWIPTFFTAEEAAQLERICEGVLPKTDTPGAIDAGVPSHLDKAMGATASEPETMLTKQGMAVFVDNFKKEQGVSVYDATTEQMTDAINGYFKKYGESPQILGELRAAMRDESPTLTPEQQEALFVTQIVDSTFWSYFTSELVGETVMRYDPVPGPKYEGCIPYEPGQKAWSSL
jgi:hypothetical protein